jgi:ApaG protein
MTPQTNHIYEAVTRDIRVRVLPAYMDEQSAPEDSYFFWAYTVHIVNEGDEPVQLHGRYWHIVDATGRMEEVRGPGVVGQTPVIAPGTSFTYTSGCPLKTPSGIMSGRYQMTASDGTAFDVLVPAFSLDSPFVDGRVN